MDAYDEDSPARRVPDGSQGARHGEGPEQHAGAGPDAAAHGGPGDGAARDGGPATGPGDGGTGGGDTEGGGTGDRGTGPGPDGGAAGGARPGPGSGPPASGPTPPTGAAALSPRYRTGAVVALAVVAVAACVHLGIIFLSLAPSNTVTKQHGSTIEHWVYPEFEQNWKLFAPNPLQQNIAVQVRAEVRAKDGAVRTTGWDDLSAEDGAAIDGSLVPSHTQQNELRRAWDFLVATHDGDNRPVGLRGTLSEEYVRRIVVMRLHRDGTIAGEGVVQRVQVRSATTGVQPPKWSTEQVSAKPDYRELPWWTVPSDEAAGGVR